MTEPVVPAALSPALAAVLETWRGLRRGGADMPFADDMDLSDARALGVDLIVLEVFQSPTRFRLDPARTPHAPRVEHDLQGRFLDEIDLAAPLDDLGAQALATLDRRGPTYDRRALSDAGRGYARLLLPFWGEGEIRLLLGAIEWC